jgi:hypothetical protein
MKRIIFHLCPLVGKINRFTHFLLLFVLGNQKGIVVNLCDEKLGDETLMDNAQCCHLLEVEDDKISIVDGD